MPREHRVLLIDNDQCPILTLQRRDGTSAFLRLQPIIVCLDTHCNQFNVSSGGAVSLYFDGEAADIYIPKTAYTDWDDNKAHTDKELAERWFSWLQSHTDYDQLIMETSNSRDFWIHVNCRKNKSKNRHQVLRLTKK